MASVWAISMSGYVSLPPNACRSCVKKPALAWKRKCIFSRASFRQRAEPAQILIFIDAIPLTALSKRLNLLRSRIEMFLVTIFLNESREI